MSTSAGAESGKWRQFFATLIANLSSLTYGTVLGWPSPTIPQLQSKNSPVGDEPMTDNEIAWLNAIGCLGGLLILPVCNTLAENCGRKITMCLIMIPFVIGWLLTAFAQSYLWLLIAQFFAKLGGSMCFFIIPIYVSEISCDEARGKFGSILGTFNTVGIVIGYTMGDLLSYRDFALTSMIFPLIFLIGCVFIPETPIYLVRKSRIADAIRSLMWLKNNDERTVYCELIKLQKSVDANSNTKKSIGFRDLYRDRIIFRGFIIATAIIVGQILCGFLIVITYAASIFEISGSTMSSNTSAIAIGLIQLVGCCLSMVTIERTGRRPLIFISCMGMTISLCILGGFLLAQVKDIDLTSFAWIPLTALSVYTVAYRFGMGSIPFIIVSEVFHSDVVTFTNCICNAIAWIAVFVVMKSYPYVVSLIGTHGVFFLFAAFCMCTYLFTYFFVPETKGRSIESIVNELSGNFRKYQQNEYIKTHVDVTAKK